MKIMLPDIICHENQSQHYQHHRCFMPRLIRTDYHAGQIFIPHRPSLFFKANEINICFIRWNGQLPQLSLTQKWLTHATWWQRKILVLG